MISLLFPTLCVLTVTLAGALVWTLRRHETLRAEFDHAAGHRRRCDGGISSRACAGEDAQGSASPGVGVSNDAHVSSSLDSLDALFSRLPDIALVVDSDLRIHRASASLARVLGRSAETVIGTSLAPLVRSRDLPLIRAFLAEARDDDEPTPAVEWPLRASDGNYIAFEHVVASGFTETDPSHFAIFSRDVSRRAGLVAQLEQAAFHDPLTSLANRALFHDRVHHALQRTARSSTRVAVLLLDLDHFKNVNDSLGHEAGDRMLLGIADRLRDCTRRSDTVCRLGGDEFSILIEHVADDETITTVADRILESIAMPFIISGHELFIGASVGVARAEAGDTPEDVLRNADVAMYHAKNRGRGGCQVFEPWMLDAAVDRLELEADLRQAITTDQFHLHYQPIVELPSGRIVGVETLLRWTHPRRGAVGPVRFIPVAEETGLIIALGARVLQMACREVARWDAETNHETVYVAVNLSGRQLQDPSLLDLVRGALDSSGLEPGRLVLEVTESVVMQNTTATLSRLRELRDLGVHIAIDDFGTGYSSLSYLHRFPIDMLKIDRSFVELLGKGTEDGAIAETIVALGRSLRLHTVAEGIETPAQRDALIAAGCRFGQGYLFSPAVSPTGLLALLAVDSGETPPDAATGE